MSGRRISKDELIIEAYGTVDELNSYIGLLISHISDQELLKDELSIIQNLLFNIGSILAKDGLDIKDYPTLNKEHIDFLEKGIDRWNTDLAALTNFILPGGSKSMSIAHICRTVSRRAERRVVALAEEEQSFSIIIQFLNRLSDYFFIVARILSVKEQVPEILWNKKLDL